MLAKAACSVRHARVATLAEMPLQVCAVPLLSRGAQGINGGNPCACGREFHGLSLFRGELWEVLKGALA